MAYDHYQPLFALFIGLSNAITLHPVMVALSTAAWTHAGFLWLNILLWFAAPHKMIL